MARMDWLFVQAVLLLGSFIVSANSLGRFGLNYSEVQNLGGVNCPNLDSCRHRRSSGRRELEITSEKNCACDYLCEEFRDCCIDAPRFDDHPVSSSSGWKCNELRQFGGVYMKETCSYDSMSPHLVELCENSTNDDFEDPLGSMPATDFNTGLTYRNYYCGLCNNEDQDNLVIWTPRLECPTLTFYNNSRKNLTHEYVFQNLLYDGTSWGLYLDGDNGSLFFHDCVIDPVMPRLLESKIRLCKPQSVSKCAVDWEDEDTKAKCAAYTGMRYLHSESYRNAHCALCNRVNISLLTCHPVEFREMFVFRTFEHHAFSLLLDINEEKGQHVGLVKKCEVDEVYDPFFKKCRRFSCLPGDVRQGRSCIRNQTTTTAEPTLEPLFSLIAKDNDTQSLDANSYRRNISDVDFTLSSPNKARSNLSQDYFVPLHTGNMTGVSYNTSMLDGNRDLESEIGKFMNCLLITLEANDYTIFANKTIFVEEYGRLYEPTSYFADDGKVLVCSHFESESEVKFSPLMGYFTVVGLGVSMFCLVLHILAFCLVPDLQNLSGKNLVSQAIALLLAYCCYIAGQIEFLDKISCTVISFLTFFFFQVSFFWMNTMAFDVWRTLKMATTELRVTSGQQWKRFVVYSTYSWATPLLILAIAALAEYTDFFPEEYRPAFAQPRCWFKHRRALLCFFAVPLFFVMGANAILFASSSRMIIITTNTTVKSQNPSQNRNFKLYLRLAILMGLTWTVGLVAGFVDLEFLWYLFVGFNTLQGLFIFVAFSCSSKVFKFVRDRVARYTKAAEFKSNGSSTTNSGCHSSTALTNVSSLKQKLSASKKTSVSPTSSFVSESSKRGKSLY